MSSMYGWLSTVAQPAASTDWLERQYAGSQCLNAAIHRCVQHHQHAGVAGHDLHLAPSVYQSAQLLVIIAGTPYWQDSHLATVAKQHGNAQALADGFLRYGRAVLDKLRGAFALCVLNPDQRYALLAVDRVGICSLAFHCQDDLLVFGSQLDSIVAHPRVKAVINPQAIFDYLYFHIIPSPNSIYSGISKLQPSEYVEVHNGQVSRDFYWQLHYHDSPASKQQLLAQLPQQLEQALLACAPDDKTGAFLSGGLDSSTVTGFYQKIAHRPIDAFTMGFDAVGYDEMAYARSAAKHFNVTLHEYYVTPADVLQAIPLIARTYDEPFGNASAVPTYYCAKFAREHGMTRLLAGDGGDELFAGNSRYAKQKVFDCYRHVPPLAQGLLEPLAFKLAPLKKLKSYIDQAKIAMPERLETYNFLHRSPLTDIFAADFLQHINSAQPLQLLKTCYDRTTKDDLIKQMLFLDGKFTLADNDLRKVNRMCELAGMSVQYPMLQDNIVEFSATIPSKWLMNGLALRSFYKQSLHDFLPKTTLNKSKQGFGLPFGVWMSDDSALKQFAEASLEGISKRGFLNPIYIKNMLELHRNGHASYYGTMIWLLVMLEQWLLAHEH